MHHYNYDIQQILCGAGMVRGPSHFLSYPTSLSHTLHPIMYLDVPDILTGALQNQVAWCLKRFDIFPAYMESDELFLCLNGLKYTRYTAVVLPVTNFRVKLSTSILSFARVAIHHGKTRPHEIMFYSSQIER